jgi:hypothetical protein
MSGYNDEVVGDKIILPSFMGSLAIAFTYESSASKQYLTQKNYLDIVTGKESRPADTADDADAATYEDIKKRQEQFDKMKVNCINHHLRPR